MSAASSFLIAALLLSVSCQPRPEPISSHRDLDGGIVELHERQVYTVILNNWPPDAEGVTLFLDPESADPGRLGSEKLRRDLAFHGQSNPVLSQDLIEDFLFRTANTTSQNGLGVIRPDEDRELLSHGATGWIEFGKRHPGVSVLVSLSRAGFSSDGQRAIVYIEMLCGWLCGYGSYLLFEKQGDTWREVDQYSAFVA